MPESWNRLMDWAGEGFYWFWRDQACMVAHPKCSNDWKWSYVGAEGAD